MENIEPFLRPIFDLSTECIYIISINGELMYSNKTARDFLMYSKNEMENMYVWDVDNIINKKEKFKKIYEKEFKKKNENEIISIKSVHKKKDGTLVPVEINSRVLNGFSKGTSKKHIISYVSDISFELKQTEDTKLYYEFIKEVNDMVFLVDIETEEIKFVNHKVCDLLGYTFEELKSKKISDIRKPFLNSGEVSEIFRNIKNSKTGFSFGKFLSKDGTYVLVETSLIMRRYLDKNYVMAISRDITDSIELEKQRESINKKLNNYNKTLEEEIQKAKKEIVEYQELAHRQSKMAAIGEMLENIAHQWRQPLSVISVISSGLSILNQEDELDRGKLEEGLNNINENTQYLSKTIDDFRNFFKPNNKKSHFYINESIEYIKAIVKIKLELMNIRLIANINNFQLYTFENELSQVLINIINNSIDEFQNKNLENKFIFIETKVDEKYFYISTLDNANGIDLSVKDRIFEPYFTTKDKFKGTGIGLYMCEEIVKDHMNGEITVDNEEYEYEKKSYKGAKFTIKLPRTN